MGEVYRGRDTRLDRTVAIKVLPRALADDAQFRERFAREARAISQLEHPHICALHDVGEQDGIAYLVMPYLDGETLADRLTRGALPVHEALARAIEIADALDAAHRAGIVHRDLKPANVQLTSSGARLLDFGLAKTGTPIVAGASASMLPTTPAALTQQGTILGTLQYMAPEQLEGADTDSRSDVFAFGAVLYEMVTGVKAFAGKSQASVISAILKDTPPPMATVQPHTPAALERVTMTCLEKRPDDRWQTMRDLRRELKWIRDAPRASSPAVGDSGSRSRGWLPWAVAAAALVAAAATGIWSAIGRTPLANTSRLEIALPADAAYTGLPLPGRSLAVSPDGQAIVYASGTQGRRQLYRRTLNRLSVDPIPGTEGAYQPFFSADGQWVAFFTIRGELKKVSLDGGPPVTLARGLQNGQWAFGTWRDDNMILFSLFGPELGGLRRLPADGGTPQTVTKSGIFPALVPSTGEVVMANAPLGTSYLSIVRQDGSESTLLRNASGAVITASGHLLFTRDGVVMAAPFDARSGVGSPKAISESVLVDRFGVAQLAVSTSGTLAYVAPARDSSLPVLGWVSQSGVFSEIGPLPAGVDRAALSPDGSMVALAQVGSDRVFLMDLARRVTTPLPLPGRVIESVAWHPDGKRITLGGNSLTLFDPDSRREVQLAAGGVAAPPKRNPSWTPDGRSVVYETFDPADAIHALTLDVGGQTVMAAPRRVLSIDSRNFWPALSPDGHWIAYQGQSDAGGRTDVYVAKFPEGSGRVQVTANGGARPFWSKTGKELFFLATPGVLQAASIRAAPKLEVGTPRTLFKLQDLSSFSASDGRFLAIKEPPILPPQRIVVVQHWLNELVRAVPHQ
jgi:eukaryotic-like serine/threonine-protein kinase